MRIVYCVYCNNLAGYGIAQGMLALTSAARHCPRGPALLRYVRSQTWLLTVFYLDRV
jgi:hypothetical protein